MESLLDDSLLRIINSQHHSNTFLLAGSENGVTRRECVIIDPGLDRARIVQGLSATQWQPIAVLCTHGHFDHIGNAGWLQTQYGIPVYMRLADLKQAKMANFMMAAFKLRERIDLPEFTLIDSQTSRLFILEREFIFHPLPGHTEGSAGITVNNLLFSGDTLFARRTALSRLPGENHAQLADSLRWLFSWIDPETLVLPGHGECARIDEIRTHNLELKHLLANNAPQSANS